MRQSTRNDAHQQAVDALLAGGHAYWSDCIRSPRPTAPAVGRHRAYDPADRDRDLGPGEGRAVRFQVPDDGGATGWNDLIRGEITVRARQHRGLRDPSSGRVADVLPRQRESTTPFMGITHVIRGEDLINVTPKYLLLRARAGHRRTDPEFAHMPLIVNEQRKKLSKRRDDVSLTDYRDRGILARGHGELPGAAGLGPGGRCRGEPAPARPESSGSPRSSTSRRSARRRRSST